MVNQFILEKPRSLMLFFVSYFKLWKWLKIRPPLVDIFKWIFLKEIFCILIRMSQKCIGKDIINNTYIGSSTGLAPSRRHAATLTNDDPVEDSLSYTRVAAALCFKKCSSASIGHFKLCFTFLFEARAFPFGVSLSKFVQVRRLASSHIFITSIVKPVCNDHLYNEIYYLWFFQ